MMPQRCQQVGQRIKASPQQNKDYGSKLEIGFRIVKHIDPDSELFMRVAQHAYNDHMDNLIRCVKCGRKFFPDRIQRHQETCAADPVKLPKQLKANRNGNNTKKTTKPQPAQSSNEISLNWPHVSNNTNNSSSATNSNRTNNYKNGVGVRAKPWK